MEIGVFGTPGVNIFFGGIILGVFGLLLLALGAAIAVWCEDSDDKAFGGVLSLVALCFLVASMILLPIGHGRQRIGDCFDRLPAATFAVDGAFELNQDVLYIVVRGENDDGDIVRECAILPMESVKDYPGRPIEPEEYWIVVEYHNSAGAEWTTNTFVPADQK